MESASEVVRGRFPLGGGNDGEKKGRGGGEEGVSVWLGRGEMRHWCCSRRDTRGKRGYDGVGAVGMTGKGARM